MRHVDDTCVWILLKCLFDQGIDISTVESDVLNRIAVSLEKSAIGGVAWIEWRLKLESDLIELDNVRDSFTLASIKAPVKDFCKAKTHAIPLGRLFCISNPKCQMRKVIERAVFVLLALVSVAHAKI